MDARIRIRSGTRFGKMPGSSGFKTLDLSKDQISGGVYFYLVAGYGEGGILDTGEEMVEIAPGPRLLAVSALRVISNTWVNINFSSLKGLSHEIDFKHFDKNLLITCGV